MCKININLIQEAAEKVDGAIHCKRAGWEAMEQVIKSFKNVEKAKKKALEANEIAQSFLKPKPLEGGEGEEAPAVPGIPTPPPPVVCQRLLNHIKINMHQF